MYQVIEFYLGDAGRTRVEITADAIAVTRGRDRRIVHLDQISLVRVSRIASQYQTAYSLSIEGGRTTLVVDYNINQPQPLALDAYRRASREILNSITQRRPDVMVTDKPRLAMRILVSACYGLPALLLAVMGYLFASDNGISIEELGPTALGGIIFLLALLHVSPFGARTLPIGAYVASGGDGGA